MLSSPHRGDCPGDHPFCVGCILNWALQKKKCPLCQVPFTHLWLYKMLDGSYNDYLVEENVDLLHCAVWFKDVVINEKRVQDAEADDDDEYHEMLQYERTRMAERVVAWPSACGRRRRGRRRRGRRRRGRRRRGRRRRRAGARG